MRLISLIVGGTNGIKNFFGGFSASSRPDTRSGSSDIPEGHGQFDCGCKYWCTVEGGPFVKFCDTHQQKIDREPTVSRPSPTDT